MSDAFKTSDIEGISLSFQAKGQLYFVSLPQDRLQILLSLAEGLSDDGRLPIKKAPAHFKLLELDPAREEA